MLCLRSLFVFTVRTDAVLELKSGDGKSNVLLGSCMYGNVEWSLVRWVLGFSGLRVFRMYRMSWVPDKNVRDLRDFWKNKICTLPNIGAFCPQHGRPINTGNVTQRLARMKIV